MKGFIILLSFVAVAVAGRGCGENQSYTECGTACPLTCENYKNPPENCAAICEMGCRCDEGYVLTKGGQCVKPENCPVKKEERCGKNQNYAECATACPLTCENYKNPPEICAAVCRTGCQCNEGYVLTKGGQCVKPEHCPVKKERCGKNQNYAECATACPLTCENYKNPPEICAAVCQTGCQCDEGYVLTKGGQCVKPKNCPVKKEERCGKNQHFEECGTACPLTCENRNNPPEVCVLSCNSGCQCDEGFVKGKGGKCVRPEQCPKPKCGRHEHYESCGTSCPLTCENYVNEPLACDKRCNQGCFCDKGYVRNGDGECVKPKKCPAKAVNIDQKNCVDKPETGLCEALFHMWYYDVYTGTCKKFIYGGCGGNGNRYRTKEECMNQCKECGLYEHYESCGTSCPLTCENYADEPLLCNKMCNPACFCDKGYVRNDNWHCVKPHECLPKARDFDQKNCVDKPETGLCQALFHMWYYDVYAGTCKKFIYGGCGGNGNRYRTKEECMNQCKV